ncbi:MAG: ATP-binding cassette domain-containing protein [Candidatus Cloacimonetes bacterium]|nr:ATP-binding cassette domain-containing protein [Candidatus Cloacimonadota bacterium]MBS3768199.1 ATP-binding cassette domain-containing protein [Candidatus Cloacimonadota bacterium]
MIKVEDLYKVYESKKKNVKEKIEAVNNISFQCKPGEIFGLLGPNGAGKTTTLRCISTLIKPTWGNIYLDEYNVLEDEKIIRSKIGFLTTDMKLDGFFTPDYMLSYFGRLNKMQKSEIEQRKEKLFNDLQMEDFIDKKIDKLSSGMTQKTAIAISLIHDPEVIIFDEPTNGLDVITAKNVTDFLEKYAEQGKTVIISTHIMSIAEKLCDRIGILIEGELKKMGSLEEIISGSNADNLEDVFYKFLIPDYGSQEGVEDV